MKLVLHIGMPKTGTTTLQRFLKTNRDALLERGLACPPPLGHRNTHWLSSFARDTSKLNRALFGQAIGEQHEEFRRAVESQLDGELERARPKAETMVLSDEGLFTYMEHPHEFERLVQLLRPRFDAISVRCYLRRQDEWRLSWYTQQLRHGPADVIPKLKLGQAEFPYEDYLGVLERWAAVFGDDALQLAVFDRDQLRNRDIVDDFMARIGVSLDELERPSAAMESLSPAAQELLRLINPQIPYRVGDGVNPMREGLLEALAASGSGRGIAAARDEARTYYSQFRDANAEIARRWMDREALFNEDFSKYPESVDDEGPTFEDGAALAAALWNSLKAKNLELRAERDLARGEVLINGQDFERAAIVLERAISFSPVLARAHYLLATARERLGDGPAALEAARRAVDLNPQQPGFLLYCAKLLSRERLLEEAAEMQRRAIELRPEHAAARYQLSESLRRLGEIDAALVLAEEALRLAPDTEAYERHRQLLIDKRRETGGG